MSSIDEELYELSNKRSQKQTKSSKNSRKRKSNRDSDSEDDYSSDDYSDYSSDSTSSRNKRRKTSRKSSKRSSRYSSEDDDNGYSSTSSDEYDSSTKKSNSAVQSQKDESDEDYLDGDTSEEFDDGFDDNLLGDSADRKYLLSLSQVERERILTERFNRRKELKESFEFKKSLRQKRKQNKSSNDRRNSRTSVFKGGKSKEDAFNKLRESRLKSNESRHQRSSRTDEDQDEKDMKSSRDAISDNNNNDAARHYSRKGHYLDSIQKEGHLDSNNQHLKRSNPTDPEDCEVATPKDLEPAFLKRAVLEKWLGEPYFDTIVVGSFVRLLIGSNPASASSSSGTAEHVYRLAQIVNVEEGFKKYKVGKKDSFKMLVLQHAAAKKAFRIDLVSNQQPTQREVTKWINEMKKVNMDILSIKDAKNIFKKQKETISNFAYTSSEIDKILAEKEKLKTLKKNLAKEKTMWSTNLIYAIDAGDEEKAERAREKLSEINESMQKRKSLHSNVSIKTINEKNRKANMMAESLRNITIDPAYNRRPTYPSILKHNVEENLEKPADKDENKDENGDKTAENSRTSSPFVHQDPEDLFKKAHNFNLEIDLENSNTLPEVKKKLPIEQKKQETTTSVNSSNGSAPRISYLEYKKRKGMV